MLPTARRAANLIDRRLCCLAVTAALFRAIRMDENAFAVIHVFAAQRKMPAVGCKERATDFGSEWFSGEWLSYC
ncbi:hypothetical protein Trydic_g12830 [Trypoxylus dichotomus]